VQGPIAIVIAIVSPKCLIYQFSVFYMGVLSGRDMVDITIDF